ncbi:hypothetical protein ABZ611_33030 [Streptomyces sp. NPDC007861]|uniref:hypothetical protein n=1 Tax=Streptomyces sp. NPDC007861 TaxID=3154893 RepID=UPI0033D6A56F
MSDSELAAQVAEKLEHTTKQIDELHKLKTTLEELQHHLGTRSRQTAAAPPGKPVTVPAARRAESAAPPAGAVCMPPATKAGGGRTRPTATPAQGTSGQKRSTRASRVLALLNKQPHTVKQITQLLAQTHPHDTTTETVIRNTLENSLVTKGLAHRTKQGRNVYYTRPTPD